MAAGAKVMGPVGGIAGGIVGATDEFLINNDYTDKHYFTSVLASAASLDFKLNRIISVILILLLDHY